MPAPLFWFYDRP